MNNLESKKNIHMIGIGGIGMSALAKYLRHTGHTVSGSDGTRSKITDDLDINYDIHVHIGHSAEYVLDDCEMVIFSPAIPESNIERIEAGIRNIQEYSYPQVLGMIAETKKTIAISGTNGKTTTTTMLVELLKHLGVDPSAIIGEYLQKYNSNFVAGQSDVFITEACEYKSSFLNINHDIAVITNITEDHLDYFDDIEHIIKTFVAFVKKSKGLKILVTNSQLANVQFILQTAQDFDITIIDYSNYLNESIELSIPGKHNQQNAAAALGVVEALGLSIAEAKKYLAQDFQGAKRRMEHIGFTRSGAMIMDDYAHNPEGLGYLISGLREFYPEKKIVMLFEPHLYSRTRDFKEAFGKALEKVDELYLFPTYRARESHNPNEDYLLASFIDSKKVKINMVKNLDSISANILGQEYASDTIIISAGAGDIWRYSHALKEKTLQTL